MDITTLSGKIAYNSDRQLEKDIGMALAPFREMYRNERVEGEFNERTVTVYGLLEAAERLVFNNLKEGRQRAAVKEFMERVENLGQELDELREQE